MYRTRDHWNNLSRVLRVKSIQDGSRVSKGSQEDSQEPIISPWAEKCAAGNGRARVVILPFTNVEEIVVGRLERPRDNTLQVVTIGCELPFLRIPHSGDHRHWKLLSDVVNTHTTSMPV